MSGTLSREGARTLTDGHVLTAEVIRRLLYRRDTALARHRATLARKLGVTDIEMPMNRANTTNGTSLVEKRGYT